MRSKRMTVLAIGLAAVLLAGWTAMSLAADGKALYDSKCTMCHGADGVAKEMWAKKGARSFNDPAWQKEKTDEYLIKVTKDGIPEKRMPGNRTS